MPQTSGRQGIREFARVQGVYTATAHSDATYGEAATAVEQGLIFSFISTILSGLHHRNPGMVGAALSGQGLFKWSLCSSNGPLILWLTVPEGPKETVLIGHASWRYGRE